MIDSNQLLREFVESGDEDAFRQLMECYANLVYSTALRRVGGDAHLAQDVTQTVFIDLARKARALQKHPVMAGWLYRHTCFTASKALRSERRRNGREQEVFAMQSTDEGEDEALWRAMHPLLDKGLASLSEKDRDAIILRFFERHPFRVLGDTLNTTEDAARVRVDRALEKLRLFFLRHGVTLSVATLSSVLLERGVEAAPVGLSNSVFVTVMAKTETTTTLALAKAMLFSNLNAVGIVGTALLITAGVLMPLVIQNRFPTAESAQTGGSIPRLANNHFANRAVLGTPGRITRTNNRADTERGERIQNGSTRWGATLWWRWTAPASGRVIVDTAGSRYDTFLAIYTGTKLNALTLITENDNASEVGVGESAVTFNAQRGMEYEIQVGGVQTGSGGGTPARGSVQLNLNMPPVGTIISPIGRGP